MAVGKDVHVSNYYARTVELTLSYGVAAKQLALINGFIGLTVQSGASGDAIVLDREEKVIEVELPASLYSGLSVGDRLYVDVSAPTSHDLPDAAYTTTASGNELLGRVVELIGSNIAAITMEVRGS
ncbi:MAG: DUF2190 family protein [Chloroflexota bacterium]